MEEVVQIRTVFDSVRGVGIRIIDFLPALAGAIVTLVMGFLLARLVGRVVERSLRALGFDRAISATVLGRYVNRLSPPWTAAHLFGALTMWFLALVTLQVAVGVLALPELSQLLNRCIGFLPNVALGFIIIVLGAVGARVVGGAVRALGSSLGYTSPERLERLAGALIGVLAVFAALSQLGIAPVVVNTLFIGFVAAVSLALGLAFGLGGRGVASELTQAWLEHGHRIVTSETSPVKAGGTHPSETH